MSLLFWYLGTTQSEVEEDIAIMKEALAKTKYVCAFGYNMREKGENVEDIFSRDADTEMYAGESQD